MNLTKRFWLFVLSSAVVVALVVILSISSGTSKKVITGSKFFVSPSDATVLIGGKIIELNDASEVALTAGNYEAEVVRVDFATTKETFTVKEGEVTDLAILLEPLNQNGRDFLLSGNEPQTREAVTYRLSLKNSSEIAASLPITQKLPYANKDFRIDYGVSKQFPDDPSKVAIYITTDLEKQRQLALDLLKRQGVNTDELEIYYRFFPQ